MIGKLKIRNLEELKETKTAQVTVNEIKITEQQLPEIIDLSNIEEEEESRTPVKKTTVKTRTAAKTTSKKNSKKTESAPTTTTIKKARAGGARTDKKQDPPPSQSRIDSFFKSSSKTFKVQAEITLSSKKTLRNSAKKKSKTNATKREAKGRKRLFDENTTEMETTIATISSTATASVKVSARTNYHTRGNKKQQVKMKTIHAPLEQKDICIDLSLIEGFEDLGILVEELGVKVEETTAERATVSNYKKQSEVTAKCSRSPSAEILLPPTPSNSNNTCIDSKFNMKSGSAVTKVSRNCNAVATSTSAQTGKKRKSNPRPCPPYKIVAGTSFAVDAFQFKVIEGVSHYFLTHYHADHYIGLTRKFSMPIYLSSITANLVRTFIPVDEQYLHVLAMNEPHVIEGVEVTAIDANHCPGAIMLIFKLSTGTCHLHTGDFRACAEMESEPIFWNIDIDTIYLDTTYISDRYAFRTQYESIDEAKEKLKDFRNKHSDKRILFVCGAYLIGKERFWSALAEEFDFSVWTEEKRMQALNAMNIPEYKKFLCNNPHKADFHVIGMGRLSYHSLVDYFAAYSNHYDMLLAIRPSGWEKNSRPQFRGKINIIGIEYSEHSSHDELQRFVMYIKPQNVISTVPVGQDQMITAAVPQKWYKYKKLSGMQRNFQPTITSYLKINTRKTLSIRNNNNDERTSATATTPSKLNTSQDVTTVKSFNQKSSPLDTLVGSSRNMMGYDDDVDIMPVVSTVVAAKHRFHDNVNENISKQNIPNTPSTTSTIIYRKKSKAAIPKGSAIISIDAEDDWLP